eukprot:752855-Hanusia_phi.AAC.5
MRNQGGDTYKSTPPYLPPLPLPPYYHDHPSANRSPTPGLMYYPFPPLPPPSFWTSEESSHPHPRADLSATLPKFRTCGRTDSAPAGAQCAASESQDH